MLRVSGGSPRARFRAWVRSAFAPPTDPRVEAERSRTLLSRARTASWLALGIIPFTIVIYNGAFFRERLIAGAITAGAADALIIVLFAAIRRGLFDRMPSLPMALLTALICNVTEAINLILTGGVRSEFIFPYYVVLFGIAILYPAPIQAAALTSALLPLGYVGVALATHASLHDPKFVSTLVLLIDVAVITTIGNLVVTNLFLREVRSRLDLEGANDRLRELDRLKSEFFANVSHELRTPLTLILAPIASLVAETKGKLLPGQRYLAETVQRNASRLLQLINDLLLLAKLDAGEPEIDRVPVDVEAALRRVVEEAQPYARSLDLYLTIDVEPGTYIWNGDERHLQRIALNLISNACKFSRPGGVVKVDLANDLAGIRIRVIDQGIGIAKQDLDRIFERFVQVESSAIRRFEGTGIGLSIVKQLVALHGGGIVAESEPGQGSTFEVHLPPMRTAASIDAAPLRSDPPPMKLQPAVSAPPIAEQSSGAQVMVVEDNPELLTYLTQELGRWYRIVPCPHSPAALDLAVASPPDLIVSDIMMPDMDGITLARRLRAAPSTREVPVLLVSAREEVEAKIAGFEAGADDYVQKPFQMQELHARIELHLRLRAHARDLRAALEKLKKAESSLVQSEKMVALGRMVAGVAHEMNNPLHFLQGNLELLRGRIPHKPALEPLFRDIDESLERMSSVTRQLLLFGRKHHEGEEGATVRLAELVPLVVKMVAPQVPKGVSIVQHVDGEQVRANPQDLFQIVLNIVHNAVQAVDPEKGEVRIESQKTGEWVEIRIADNGCGIPAENLSRIFDPFFTTKPPGSGTGLGLSIVQELVAAQDGMVAVHSEEGRGTTISVALKAVEA